MWKLDRTGEVVPGDREALVRLRERAREMINRGSRERSHLWHASRLVRLRDEAGEILFEGTVEEAANL